MPRDPVVVLESSDPADRVAADLLSDELKDGGWGEARIVARGSGAFVLTRSSADSTGGDEEYTLASTRDGVRIGASGSAGLYYGVQTLRQLLTPDGVPCARIRDRPALRWRGVQEDIARAGAPEGRALEGRIALAASLKLNLYVLYNEVSITSARHPLLGHPSDALSAEDVRALTAFARRHHIALVLGQQSLGHLEEVLRHERYRPLAVRPGSSTLAPGTTGTGAFLDSLYEDLVPLFDGPFVHVGGDEPGDLAAPGARAPRAERVYADHITQLSERLRRFSRRPIVWSDYALAHPATIPLLPTGTVVAIWDYGERASYDSLLAPFRSAGLDVIVCPGMMNWKRLFPRIGQALRNADRMTRAGVRAGAIGQLDCSWADDGEFVPGLLAYPMAFAAASAWQGDAGPTLEGFARDFDWACFRLERHDVAEAVQLLSGIHERFEATGGPDASVRLLELDPLHPGDRLLVAVLDSALAGAIHDSERAAEFLARARSLARENDVVLDDHLFAARRMHLVVGGLELGRRWRTIYHHAQASLAAGNRRAASRDLQELVDALAALRNESLEVRGEHARLLEQNMKPGRRDLMLLRDDRACQRWSALYDQFSRLAVWCELGQALPPEKALALP